MSTIHAGPSPDVESSAESPSGHGRLREWRPDDLMTHAETAAYTRMPPSTLYQINWRGTGPRRLRVAGRVLYRKRDVDAWLDSLEVDGVRA